MQEGFKAILVSGDIVAIERFCDEHRLIADDTCVDNNQSLRFAAQEGNLDIFQH